MKTHCLLVLTLLVALNTYCQTITPSGPTSFCANGSVVLNAPAGTNYLWYDNGTLIAAANGQASYTATATGGYTVAYNASGKRDSTQPLVVTVGNPAAGFTFSPNNACSSTPVKFTSTSTGNGLQYEWDFGDADSFQYDSSNLANPTHRFVKVGTTQTPYPFTVTLTVTDNIGCTSAVQQTVNVNKPNTALNTSGNQKPYGNSQYIYACVGNVASEPFTFTSADQTATHYEVYWQNPPPGTPDYTGTTPLDNTTHSFPLGISTLTYIVTDGGCTDTTTYKVFVGANPGGNLDIPSNTPVCTGSTFSYNFTPDAKQNTPGTSYTITINDQTPPTVIYQPASPATLPSYTHTFNTSSCNSTTSPYFTVSVSISNACYTPPTESSPIIEVDDKPAPGFVFKPADTVCINAPDTIISTATALNTIDPNTNSCNQTSYIVWSITPGTNGVDWTVQPGYQLGNNNNSADPTQWTLGTNTVVVQFNKPGVYTITQQQGSSPGASCGDSSLSKTVYVNPQTTASFTLSQPAGCSVLTDTAKATSNTLTYGKNSYLWSVTPPPNYDNTCGTYNAVQFGGTTSDTSQNPVFIFASPGAYSVNLTVSGPQAACQTNPAPQTVTVNSQPVVTGIGISPDTICQNTFITPNPSVGCLVNATTYKWAFVGSTTTTSTAQAPGNIPYNNKGRYPVTFIVNNNNTCGADTLRDTVTVNPVPVLTVPANDTVCAGAATKQYKFKSSIAGTVFSWTIDNPAIGISGSSGNGDSIPTFTAINNTGSPLTGTVTVTGTVTGCSGQQQFSITINPTPGPPTVVSPQSLCTGTAAAQLTATPYPGNTLLWYTAPAGGTGSATAPTPPTTNEGTLNYYVSQVSTISSLSCISPRAQIAVVVDTVPTITFDIAMNPSACGTPTGSITIAGLIPGVGYTVYYTFNGQPQVYNPNPVSASASGKLTLTGFASGTYTDIFVNASACNSDTIKNAIVLKDPNPPPAPTTGSNSPVCSGDSVKLMASSAVGNRTFNWIGLGITPGIANSQNPAFVGYTNLAGIYSVTVTDANGCTSPVVNDTVQIDSTPVMPVIVSTSPVCSGSSFTLSDSITYNYPVTYLWSPPVGSTSAGQTLTINPATAANTGTYTLLVTNVVTAPKANSCPAPLASIPVTVNQTPNITGYDSTNPTKCAAADGTITLLGLTPNTAYNVVYTSSAGGTQQTVIHSDNNGDVTITGLAQGQYTGFSLQDSTSQCTSNTLAGPVRLTDPNPPPAPVAASNSPGCNGSLLNLSATPVATGNYTYTWSGPCINVANSSTQNPSFSTTPSCAGTYYVTVTANNCTSQPDSVAVVVDTLAPKPVITGNPVVCSGDTLTLASSVSGGNFSNSWNGPGGFASNQPSFSIPGMQASQASQAGQYCDTAYNFACPNLDTSCVTVVVNPTPAITQTVTNPTSCGTNTGSITLQGLSPITAYTLQFSYNGGGLSSVPIVTNPTGIYTIGSLPAGTYGNIQVISTAGCSSNILGPDTLAGTQLPTPIASSNSPVCVGSPLQLTAYVDSAVGNVTWGWSGPGINDSLSTVQNPTIDVTTLQDRGKYTVTATINGCSSQDTVEVVIDRLSVGGQPINDSVVCQGTNTGQVQLTGNVGGVQNWEYSTNNGGDWETIKNSASATYTYNNLKVTTWFRAVVKDGQCDTTHSGHAVITVIDSSGTASTGPNQLLCNQKVVNLSANEPLIGTGTWSQTSGPGGALISNTADPGTFVSNMQPGTYVFQWTITGPAGCGTSAASVQIVNRPQVTQANAGADTDICNFNSTETITLNGNANSARPYEQGMWTILSQPANGGGTFGLYSSPQSTFTFSQTGTYVLQWSIQNDVTPPSACSMSSASMKLTVLNPPVAGFTISPTRLCTGQSVTVSNSSTNANGYVWNWGDASTSAFANGTHTYTSAGTFTVSLVAEELEPFATCADTTTQTVTVDNTIAAQINITPGTACVPYNLQANAVGAAGANQVQWVVYDQAQPPGVFYATGDSVAHTYYFAETDSIKLIVNNQNVCVDSTTQQIKVYNVPVTTFTPLNLSTCNHDTTIVYQASTAYAGTDPINYEWFVNGVPSGDANPFNFNPQVPVTDTATQAYTIKLLAQNAALCGDTSQAASLAILPLPQAAIKVSPSTIIQTPDYTFTFEDSAAGDAYKQDLWYLGDATQQTRTGSVVTYQYSDTGSYNVKLYAYETNSGCTATDSVIVTIQYIPGYLQVPDAICPGCAKAELRQFLPLGKGLSYYHLQIFTLWGKLVFETTALNADGSPQEAWNALVNGQPADQATYRWQIEARFINGTEWPGMLYPKNSGRVKSGFLTVIK